MADYGYTHVERGLDYYTMTPKQTAIYESNNHAAIDHLHRAIDDELAELRAEDTEIYTADGIVAWMYVPNN